MGDAVSSLTVVEQQLDELDTLHAEATGLRRRLLIEAVQRVQSCIIRGIRPNRDDAMIVQGYIAERQQQDRYGR